MERCLLRYQSHWFTFSFRLALFKKCLFSQSHRGSPVSYLGSCLDFPPCRPHFCIPLPSGVIFLSLHLSSILAQTFPPLQGTLVSAPVLVQNPGSKASPARASPSACSPHVGGAPKGRVHGPPQPPTTPLHFPPAPMFPERMGHKSPQLPRKFWPKGLSILIVSC